MPSLDPAATVILLREGSNGFEVLMVERNAMGAFGSMVVFPGGRVDQCDLRNGYSVADDESHRMAGIRELAEEAGLAAARWEEGPRFFTAPGFCDELMHLYLATGLTPARAEADADELLEADWMSLSDALAAIDDGRVRDAKTIAGVGWLARRLPTHPDT